jgi:hypothetical protein
MQLGSFLALGHACCALSLGLGYARGVSRMQLGRQEDVWGAAVGGGGVGHSSRRRRVFQKNKARRGTGHIKCSSMRKRLDARVYPDVWALA